MTGGEEDARAQLSDSARRLRREGVAAAALARAAGLQTSLIACFTRGEKGSLEARALAQRSAGAAAAAAATTETMARARRVEEDDIVGVSERRAVRWIVSIGEAGFSCATSIRHQIR